MLLIILGGLAWNILPFLASIIGMLIFAFLLTTIFLQGVDRLERYTRSRSLGVFLILTSVISIGIVFFGSFVSNLGSQIKLFTQKLQKEDFALSLENLSGKIRDSLPDFLGNMIPEGDKMIVIAKNSLVNGFQSILPLFGSAGGCFFIVVFFPDPDLSGLMQSLGGTIRGIKSKMCATKISEQQKNRNQK